MYAKITHFVNPRQRRPSVVTMLMHVTEQGGPILIQHDFLPLIAISSHLSSDSHSCINKCNSVTEGPSSKISSACRIIAYFWPKCKRVAIASNEIANKVVDRTKPCLRVYFIGDVREYCIPSAAGPTAAIPTFDKLQ